MIKELEEAKILLKDIVPKMKQAQDFEAKKTRAVELAYMVLQSDPKPQTECELRVTHGYDYVRVETCACTECKAVNQGNVRNWKRCPSCGSNIVGIDKSYSPETSASILEPQKAR